MVETMEIQKGFKKTDVGIIPCDWDVKPISEITSLMTNGFVGTVKSHYTDYDNGILYIQGYNVEENSFNFNGIKRVTNEFHKQHLKSCLQEGDLLTIQTGDIGVTTVVSKELEGTNCHALIITRFKKDTVATRFYSYYFNYSGGRKRLKEIETGSTMKHINVGDMFQMLIPYPTKAEQTAIATALNDVDALITQLEKLIAKKRAIKQGTMQELLKPKEGWEVKKLGEIAEFFKGRGLPKSSLTSDGSIKCIHYGELFLNYKEEITKIKHRTNEFEGAFYSKANDVLMPTSDVTPNGLATASCLTENGVLLGGDILVIRIPTQIVNGSFLSYYIRLNRNEVMRLVKGVTVYHLHASDMKDYFLKYPNVEEQNRISNILFDMENEIEKLEVKLSKYKMLKQGMMQNLLTGRIRLV